MDPSPFGVELICRALIGHGRSIAPGTDLDSITRRDVALKVEEVRPERAAGDGSGRHRGTRPAVILAEIGGAEPGAWRRGEPVLGMALRRAANGVTVLRAGTRR